MIDEQLFNKASKCNISGVSYEEHLGDIILNDKKDVKRTKITSVIAFTLVILILSLLIGGVMFLKEIFSPGKELIGTTESIDGKYTVEAYLINGGATVDWAVRCYLKTKYKFGEKMIYNDYHVDSAIMIWEDDDTININGHIIDLPNGKYDFRYD